MEPTQKPKTTAKDFFLNLGASVSLFIIAGYLVNLLFTVINKAYPLTTGYNYYGSSSISWPVATLIIFFPIYILLMCLLERGYSTEPERRNMGVRKWLTYLTLFLAGLSIAGDLVTVVYYFIDGQDITAGFILKVLSVFVVALTIFSYYISDVLGKFDSSSRKFWVVVATFIILASIVWGFAVLGSPRTQQLLKYDEQKVVDLQDINNQITSYYMTKGFLPETLVQMVKENYYTIQTDQQNQKPYEYKKITDKTYNLCAEFNKESKNDNPLSLPNTYGRQGWEHLVGHYCFELDVNSIPNSKIVPKF